MLTPLCIASRTINKCGKGGTAPRILCLYTRGRQVVRFLLQVPFAHRLKNPVPTEQKVG